MPRTITHLVIADKICHALGKEIENILLFFGGNIAPDAIHAKKDYQRLDKKRSHLCEGIRSYGYGYPEVAELFQNRINEFIENYYLPAEEEKDLYLGYLVHLLADELYLCEYYRRLEEQLNVIEASADIPILRKNLADKINNNEYNTFFADMVKVYDISVHAYRFNQNMRDVLDAVWDYEINDYVKASEINASKHWVIQKYFSSDTAQHDVMNIDSNPAIKFADDVVENIAAQIKRLNLQRK